MAKKYCFMFDTVCLRLHENEHIQKISGCYNANQKPPNPYTWL